LHAHADVDETVRDIEAAGPAERATSPTSPIPMPSRAGRRDRRPLRPLDILVNNAAIRPEQPFADDVVRRWRHVLAVILDGAFLCSHACVAHLARSGGGIDRQHRRREPATGARGTRARRRAKAGLAGIHQSAGARPRAAAHHRQLRRPRPSSTPSAQRRPARASTFTAAVPPIGRLGRPDEVAAMVRMLCGPDARYITGQAIHVNGGGICREPRAAGRPECD
jgi:3-oxoacyl-[acyl-carrier protein] reductase